MKSLHPALKTPACTLFGCDYPIVQTGMGWVADPHLTAATSEAGGLGILAAATLSFDEMKEAISIIKSKTKKPFGVNLRADQVDAQTRIDLLIQENVRVASFAQAPSQDLIVRLKEGGVLSMPTIGAKRHAEKVAAWGVDAAIAQGHEGGGHTGPVPTTLLLPQACSAVEIPILGAGGFYDGKGLVAALAYGAAGIAMGTRFLLTKESPVPHHIKEIYLQTGVKDTVVTRHIDGYPQRVISNALVQRLERASTLMRLPKALLNALALRRYTATPLLSLVREGLAMRKSRGLTWSQMAMAANAPMLTKATMVDGNLDAGILPTGQVTGVIHKVPTVAQVIQDIMEEASNILHGLTRPLPVHESENPQRGETT